MKAINLLPKFATTLGVLVFASASAYAATPVYTAFTGSNGLNAPGIMTPDGSTIDFPLVRQDLSTLTIKLKGVAAQPAAPEAVAGGYVDIHQNTNFANTYFVTAAFPALASELTTLESALELIGLPITAVADQTVGTNKVIYTVHVEGTITEPATILAGGIATALATISSPQLNVLVQYPGVIFPDIPKKFQRLTDSSTAELVDGNAVVFSIPRNDANPITLGSVIADPSVGVGETVVISGNGTSLITAELALKPNEVQPVLAILIGGGFTVSSAGDYFTNDSPRLTFIHVVAASTTVDGFQAQAEQLGFAILKAVKSNLLQAGPTSEPSFGSLVAFEVHPSQAMDKIALNPDSPFETFGNIDIYLFDQILRGNLVPGMSVLDAGCGYGRNLVYLLRARYRCFGVDENADAIDEVRHMAAALSPRAPSANFRVEGIEAMSFADGSMDAVLLNAVLHFASDDAHFLAMLRGAWRTLKPDGLLFCRTASTIGMEHLRVAGRHFRSPDGAERYCVDEAQLLRLTAELGGELIDPLKTTVVQDQRCMTTWVVRKR